MNNTKKYLSWIIILLLAMLLSGTIYYFFNQTEKVPAQMPIVRTTETATLTPTKLAASFPSPTPTIIAPTVTPKPTKSSAVTSTPAIAPKPLPTDLPSPTPTPTNQPDFALTHEVVSGEYLTGISLHYYGTGRKWLEIYEATNARGGEGPYKEITDPNLIFPGDWVRVPIKE